MVGKTLAHYEIASLIGKGGMGEVYQAKDQKLGRDVAIKVLPEEFAKDADRVARFQREAKMLASLNHPNIASIYGLEEANRTHFLVLVLIEGDTLADRIKGGPIPVEESLKLALQIAEALEAAHEKGVIHRDLKPANIKVTPDGKVKVLDFGLAKAFAGEQSDLNLSNSPTLSDMATQQGLILGTAAYMSPEQARGKPVDKRTDIWAFGCVLYEMLTGKAAFQGEDVTETLAAVVKSGVNLDLLPANIHPRVCELISRCLQKDQKKRYSGIADAQYEIEQVLADPSGVFAQPVMTAKARKKMRLGIPWVAAAIAVTAIIVGFAVMYLRPPEPKKVVRFDYELPNNQQFGDLTERAFAISPDGSQLVYATNKGLYLRSMNEMDSKLLPGTGGSMQRPFFSPDGEWIGFFCSADNRLKKIAISGGAPVTLAEVSIFGSFDWGADGTIRYGQTGKGIMGISDSDGTPGQLIKPAGDETIGHPQILPGGDSVLLMRALPEPTMIMMQSLKSGERKELFEGTVAKYLPTGIIVYELGGSLFAVRFDLKALRVIGGPILLMEGILRVGGAPQYAISESGTLAYIPGTSAGSTKRTLVWVDRNGKEEPLGDEPTDYYAPTISPDGTQVALCINVDGNPDIYIYDLVRKTPTRLTFDPAGDYLPIWTPDGKRIVFDSERAGRDSIFWKAADGSGKAEQLVSVPNGWAWPSSLSGDGSTLLFGQVSTGTGNYDIGMLSMAGDDRTPKLLLQGEYNEKDPMISPDGRWLAYMSNESGQYEIFVRPFPDVDSGGKRQVSRNGGNNPLWSPDGQELFYRNGDKIMVVPVEIKPAFRLGNPEVLFEGPYFQVSLSNAAITSWDITQDAKRFLMMKEAEAIEEDSAQRAPRKINIILNWFEELKERVPTD
jgi:serine/threonine protein kinase/Tol biopolymer transport system component